MGGFFGAVFSWFLSPLGLLVLAALDTSMLFFLPAAVDIAVIILSARDRELFWAFPLLAAAGSLVGAYVTFRIGSKIGENSLECWIPKRRLKSVQEKVRSKGAIALAIPGLLPPPFPLTPFILACGALNVSKGKFFATLGAVRLLRFGIEALLALAYGRRIITVLESDTAKSIVAGLIVIALFGSVYSTYRIVVSTRTNRGSGKDTARQET